MKILYVYDKYPTTYQTYLLETLEVMKKSWGVKSLVYENAEQADHNMVSYSFQDSLQRLLYKLKLSKYRSSDIKTMHHYDIIHIQHSYLWKKVLPFENMAHRPKILVTLRGGDTYIKPWLDASWCSLYKEKCHLIDAFVVMSQNQKEYLMRWGVQEDKIYVIPISFGLLSTAQPKYPNPGKLKLVSAFRMTWEKNIEGSIQLARLLKDKNVDFQYDIYGDGTDLGQLYYLVDRYDLGNYVFIKGKMDNKLLEHKLADYDFFIQLSISESLGMSVIEAQSRGVPCIVSDSDGLKETGLRNESIVVGHYRDLEYFSKEILRLREDKQAYYAFSTEAIQFVNQHFSTGKEVDKLIKLYRSIT